MKNRFSISRKVWQPLWCYILGNIDIFNDYCKPYENAVFKVIPYSWNEDYWNNEYHFWHKPSDVKIEWYKYPLRSATCNKEITPEQFVDILYDCVNSLQQDKEFKIIHEIDKWWDK